MYFGWILSLQWPVKKQDIYNIVILCTSPLLSVSKVLYRQSKFKCPRWGSGPSPATTTSTVPSLPSPPSGQGVWCTHKYISSSNLGVGLWWLFLWTHLHHLLTLYLVIFFIYPIIIIIVIVIHCLFLFFSKCSRGYFLCVFINFSINVHFLCVSHPMYKLWLEHISIIVC